MKRFAAFVTVTITLMIGTSLTAHADDGYLNEAAQALQASNTYVSPSVPGVDATAIQNAIGGKDIAVVVLPADAATGHGGASGFVQELGSQANHKTVVVVIGNDIDAGSSVLPKGEASRIANEAEGYSGDLTARIVDAVNGIASKQQTQMNTSTGTPPSSNEFNPIPGILGWGGSIVLLLAIAAWAITKWRRRTPTDEPPSVKMVQAPGTVRDRVREVLALRTQIKDSQLNELLTYIAQHVEEYFVDATKQSDGTYKAADDIAKYIGLLQTVVGRYIKVQNKPKYYRDSDQKKAEYARAIESCEKYMLEQVRAVNDAEEFDFAKAAATLAASDLRSIHA